MISSFISNEFNATDFFAKIFVFDEGRIVGEGSHDELLNTNEYYQRLVHNQVIMA